MVPIKRAIEKVPGGMMVVPLFLGCLMKSFFPGALEIGSFTTALTQPNPIMAVFLVCMGANLSLKAAPRALKTGTVITLTKFAVGVAVGLIVAKLFGDNLMGLSSLAIISAMTNSNGGIYCALTGEYGTEEDVAAYTITALNDGPFFTMIAMGVAGLATIPFLSLVAVVIPIIIGMILGNLDAEMKEFLTKGSDKLIFFFAFGLGTGLTVDMLIKGGLSGVVLGVLTVLLTGAAGIFMDRLTGGSGIAGAALSSTAGNAVVTPAALAEADPTLAAMAPIATPQVAGATITTAILTPLLTSWYAKYLRKKQGPEAKTPESAEQVS